jgi:hypothetical protein
MSYLRECFVLPMTVTHWETGLGASQHFGGCSRPGTAVGNLRLRCRGPGSTAYSSSSPACRCAVPRIISFTMPSAPPLARWPPSYSPSLPAAEVATVPPARVAWDPARCILAGPWLPPPGIHGMIGTAAGLGGHGGVVMAQREQLAQHGCQAQPAAPPPPPPLLVAHNGRFVARMLIGEWARRGLHAPGGWR